MTGSCWCGRSESGLCTGLHKFSEAEYKKFLEEKDKPKEDKQPEIKMKNDIPQVYTEEVVNKIITFGSGNTLSCNCFTLTDRYINRAKILKLITKLILLVIFFLLFCLLVYD